ncbi:MAG: pentapeptide repeat-containing protein [Trichodesmium sp.]
MANVEHLEKLQQGVNAWNKWQQSHKEVKPDLSGADLRGADLSGADLREADLREACLNITNLNMAILSRANLSGADLLDANLREANLSGANLSSSNLSRSNLFRSNLIGVNLSKANLSGADLINTNLREANLKGASLYIANLKGADLNEADLQGANLKGAYLNGVYLQGANLNGAYLQGANLNGAYLQGANLNGAYLQGANLNGGYLRGANLNEADLSGVDLSETDLSKANLTQANLTKANLTRANLTKANLTVIRALETDFEEAILTGACIQNWNISSNTNLTNVKCDYIFLELGYSEETGQIIYTERYPQQENTNLEPRDFAKLVKKIKETVNLIFCNGINWQAFLTVYEQLKVELGADLWLIKAIENQEDGTLIVRIKAPSELDKKKIEQSFAEKYQTELDAINLELEEETKIGQDLQYDKTNLCEIIKLLAQVNHNEVEEKKLAETVAEIQQLLKNLEKSNPIETIADQMTVAAQAIEIVENNSTLKQRVIDGLKSEGTEAFKEALDNAVANVLVAAFQGWIEQ